jgi:hypothetical protein
MDGFLIRRTATERRIPCFTSLDTLRAALDGSATPARTVRTVDEYRWRVGAFARSRVPFPSGDITAADATTLQAEEIHEDRPSGEPLERANARSPEPANG